MNNKDKSSIIYQNVTLKDVTLYGKHYDKSLLKGFTSQEISLHLYDEDFKSQDKWKALEILDHDVYNKKRAKAYKESFHRKYDELILWFNKKLPNAKFNTIFKVGIDSCIKAKSDLPYYEEFYNEYFTKYNVDSIIDYAYTLSEKEKDMCKTLLIASIQLYRDTYGYRKESSEGGKVMDLSDVYVDIRYKNEVWCEDGKVINYLIDNYRNRITNTTLPLKGNIAPFGKLRDLQKAFENYDEKIEKTRFMRLVKRAINMVNNPSQSSGQDTNMESDPSAQSLIIDDNTYIINKRSKHEQNTSHKDIPHANEQTNEGQKQIQIKTDSLERKVGIDTKTEQDVESFPEEVRLNIVPYSKVERHTSAKNDNFRLKNNFDYSEHEKINQEIGDKGENIVLHNEIRKTKSWNLPEKLLKKIRRVSLESDDYGYDILSYDKDGNELYIEVKTTKASCEKLSFILTRNELEQAKKYGKNYSIVIVFDIMRNPRIWYMGNPFSETPFKVNIEPIKYMVTVNTDNKK